VTDAQQSLDGRRAIVTGAGGGIGRAICRTLLEYGASVAGIDVAVASLDGFRDLGPRFLAIEGDVADPEAVGSIVGDVANRWGGIDILVNNAAVSISKPLFEVSVDDWRRTIDTNLSAYFYLAQRVARVMVSAGAGRIVNVASVNSVAAELNAVPYVASKGGVAALTRALAVELGPSGITVNSVAPGPTEHSRNTAAFRTPEQRMIIDRVPLRRTGLPEEVAELVAWLCSDKASYINGEMIVIDGGLTVRI
jgi:NAD(P)-dependent dehydrogenase (short-subunit alcohol dehydrogenase family)